MAPTSNAERAQRLLHLGTEHRIAQRSEEALAAISEAAAFAPDDPGVALAHARVRHETWRSSVAEARRAVDLSPGNPAAVAMLAFSLAAAGEVDAADAMLTDALRRHPAWLAGHRQLLQLRLTAGRRDGFDRTIAASCAAQPDNLAVRLLWFQTLVSIRDWARARDVVGPAASIEAAPLPLRLARLFLASESDEASRDPRLFDAVRGVEDVGLDIARTRYHLRLGQPERAAEVAQRRIGGPSERAFWPYLSLAWRMLGDGRAAWLDRDDTAIVTVDLGLTDRELAALARLLRSLLLMTAPMPEQSVRGGVQTDRHLFFHPDPAIVQVRDRALRAVHDYAAHLSPLPGGHPLGIARGRPVAFEGSWSVLLDAGGHHAPHTHSRGWLSSALHVELADDDAASRAEAAPGAGGEAGVGAGGRAGWTSFGDPPDELGLGLPATRTIRPSPGRLILFPSTTWHRTIAFDRGQRLSIAFDVAPRTPATR